MSDRKDSGQKPLWNEIERLELAVKDLQTQRDRAREQLAAAKRLPRLEEMVEFSPDMILLVQAGGAILDCNKAAAEQLGMSREELLGKALSAICPDADELSRSIARASSTGAAAVECAFKRADGRIVTMELAIGSNPGPGSVLVIAGRDMSGRMTRTARRMQMDRMVAIGTLAAGVAHEINNPLTYVLSNIWWALEVIDQLPPSPMLSELKEALADAGEGAERVSAIVDNLDTLSRKKTQSASASVGTLLQAAVGITENQLRHRARLTQEIDTLPDVRGSSARLGQAFVNLLMNAAQAIETGHASDNEISIVAKEEGNRVVVRISDTGCGIPEDLLPHIFDPFFTTKSDGDRMGIGLSICHDSILSCGGDIQVQSQIGAGTTFVIKLPIYEDANGPSSRSHASEEAPASVRRRRVLVIDDDPKVCAAASRMLSRHYDVDATTSCRDAARRLSEGQRYDAIVCDLALPEMSGEQFYEFVHHLEPSQASAMLFMTGGAFTSELQRFALRMKKRCLNKPFSSDAIHKAVEKLIRHQR